MFWRYWHQDDTRQLHFKGVFQKHVHNHIKCWKQEVGGPSWWEFDATNEYFIRGQVVDVSSNLPPLPPDETDTMKEAIWCTIERHFCLFLSENKAEHKNTAVMFFCLKSRQSLKKGSNEKYKNVLKANKKSPGPLLQYLSNTWTNLSKLFIMLFSHNQQQQVTWTMIHWCTNNLALTLSQPMLVTMTTFPITVAITLGPNLGIETCPPAQTVQVLAWVGLHFILMFSMVEATGWIWLLLVVTLYEVQTWVLIGTIFIINLGFHHHMVTLLILIDSLLLGLSVLVILWVETITFHLVLMKLWMEIIVKTLSSWVSIVRDTMLSNLPIGCRQFFTYWIVKEWIGVPKSPIRCENTSHDNCS